MVGDVLRTIVRHVAHRNPERSVFFEIDVVEADLGRDENTTPLEFAHVVGIQRIDATDDAVRRGPLLVGHVLDTLDENRFGLIADGLAFECIVIAPAKRWPQ